MQSKCRRIIPSKTNEKITKFKVEFKERVIEDITKNWNIAPLLEKANYEKYVVIIELSIDPKGQVKEVNVIYPETLEGDFLVAKRLAMSAIAKSVPFKMSEQLLPEGIKLKIAFEPSSMTEN